MVKKKKTKAGYKCKTCGYASSKQEVHHGRKMEPQCKVCFEAKSACVC